MSAMRDVTSRIFADASLNSWTRPAASRAISATPRDRVEVSVTRRATSAIAELSSPVEPAISFIPPCAVSAMRPTLLAF